MTEGCNSNFPSSVVHFAFNVEVLYRYFMFAFLCLKKCSSHNSQCTKIKYFLPYGIMANRKILQLHFYEPWMLFEENDLKALYGAFWIQLTVDNVIFVNIFN